MARLGLLVVVVVVSIVWPQNQSVEFILATKSVYFSGLWPALATTFSIRRLCSIFRFLSHGICGVWPQNPQNFRNSLGFTKKRNRKSIMGFLISFFDFDLRQFEIFVGFVATNLFSSNNR